MISGKYLIEEEIRQMECHKWVMSQKEGHDVGESAFFDWVQMYENSFRNWAKNIPENCINCGLKCPKRDIKCISPFIKHRINFLQKEHII